MEIMNPNLTPIPMDACMNTPLTITENVLYDDDEKGKLFVGGLSWDTTHATLLKYFGQFGEIVDCVVMKNQQTGKSRGFGFVKFKDPNTIDEVLLKGPHWLDGRQVDPKACNPRSLNKGGKSAENSRRKIFVGGLPPNCDEAQLKEVFRQFGPVEEATIMFDQEKNRSRGFGFLTFVNESSRDKVCAAHFIHINGKQVEVKKAEPRQVKSIADTGNFLQGAQGMIIGLPSPGASGAMGVVQNMSTGSLSGSPQQMPSPVGAAMQQIPGGQFLTGPGLPAGVAVVPYNAAAAFGGGYYCSLPDQSLQFHSALGVHALPMLPGGMAFAAGTGDPVIQNKNIISPTLQMGKGLVPAGEFTGVQAVNASGAENASGAQMSFQPRVTYTCPGVPQIQGNLAPAYSGEITQVQAAGDAPGGPQYVQHIPANIGRIPTNHGSSIFPHFHPYRR